MAHRGERQQLIAGAGDGIEQVNRKLNICIGVATGTVVVVLAIALAGLGMAGTNKSNLSETNKGLSETNMLLSETNMSLFESLSETNVHLSETNKGLSETNMLLSETNTSLFESLSETNVHLSETNTSLHKSVQQLQDNRHNVYIRWGHLECPYVPETTRIYQGFAASSDLTNGTPTPVSQCLPEENNHVHYQNNSMYEETTVYKIQVMTYNTFIRDRSDKGVACALCKVSTRSTVVMIPATTECNSTDPNDRTWTKEYSGYLMIASGAGSNYYCVDSTMETVDSNPQNINVAHLNHVVMDPPHGSVYNDEKVLSCVVCTT